MTLRFPRPLQPGDRIGVTAPSAGVAERARPRIEHAIGVLRAKGYEVVVGECVSADRWVSAPKADRAAELTAMLVDPAIRAVVPPWGGAGTALDLLDQLDLDAIAAAEPTWFVGYSDTATLLTALTLRTGLATLHGAEELDVSGVLIGGCIEVMSGIAGTPYGDVRAFGREHGDLIVYLEAAESDAFDICRALHHLRYCGWFDAASAILIGRTSAPAGEGDGGLSQDDAVLDALGGLGVPIVFDLEIGHVPPHLPLLNGASARVVVAGDEHRIEQTWTPGR